MEGLTNADQDNVAALNAIASVTAGSENSRATLKIVRSNLENDFTAVDQVHGIYDWTSSLSNWSLILSAPIQKSSASTNIFATGVLPSDFQAKVGYSIFDGRSRTNFDEYTDVIARARKACEDAEKDHPDKLKQCSGNMGLNADQVVKQYLPNLDYSQLTEDTYAYTLGVEASVGYLKSDFIKSATAKKDSTTNTPWSAKAYAGWVPSNDAFLILGGLEYQKSYADGKSGTLCPTGSGGSILTCVSGALDAPKESEKLIGSAEIRRQLPLGEMFQKFGLKYLGVDLKVAYDTKNRVTSIDLPLSVAMDDKKNLIGGVRFDWQSDNHDFIAGLFMGSAFSLF